MKKFFFIACCLLCGLPATVHAADTLHNVSAYAKALLAAYEDANIQFYAAENGEYANVNGTHILLLPQTGCPQTMPHAQADPPLCTIFTHPYDVGVEGRYPAHGVDPGRIRNQALLKALYGNNRQEVQNNCAIVNFLGRQVLFNKQHGAAEALTRVSQKLKSLLKEQPEMEKYIFPLAGTFYWRTIKNTQRLSAHSFAIAIDLNAHKGIYWLWEPRPSAQKLAAVRQEYPHAIVDAFESEGFIWGGKWDAFDFMHFEYRPEFFQ